jgi:hypothetical protein
MPRTDDWQLCGRQFTVIWRKPAPPPPPPPSFLFANPTTSTSKSLLPFLRLIRFSF